MRDQPSTSSNSLVIIHNTPKVQTDVEQPIIEVLRAANNIPMDEFVMEMSEIIKQRIEQHDP